MKKPLSIFNFNLPTKKRITYSMIVFFFLLLIFRFFSFLNTYSVNLLYWDQWDFYSPLFQKESYLKIFLYEHAPHRQGLGFLIDSFVLEISNWDSYYESTLIFFAYFLCGVIALFLKGKITGKYQLCDIVIPFIFISIRPYETIFGSANPSHGSFPLLLILIFASSFYIKNSILRLFTQVIVNFLSIYTGFAFYCGLLFPCILMFELIRTRNNLNLFLAYLLCLVLAALSLYSFFIDYVFVTSVSCFKFPHDKPIEYAYFIFYQFSHLMGFKNTKVAGFIFIFLTVFVLLVSFSKMFLSSLRKKITLPKFQYALFLMISFSLFFSANTAIGRVCRGLDYGQVSRYLPYLFPALFSLYLYLVNIKFSKYIDIVRKIFIIIFVIVVVYSEINIPSTDRFNMEQTFLTKLSFRNCYFSTHDLTKCNAVYPVYPATEPIEGKIEFLKKNKLNLFKNEFEHHTFTLPRIKYLNSFD